MTMMLSCLGREWRLCAAELAAVLGASGLKPNFVRPPAEVALVRVTGSPSWDDLQTALGGTVKLAQAVACDAASWQGVLDDMIDDYLTSDYSGGKLNFGVSVYRAESGHAPARSALAGRRAELEQDIKQRLTARDIRARFVPPAQAGGAGLSSAQVQHNQLAQDGLELIVALNAQGDPVALGRTRTVQPIDTYVAGDAMRGAGRFREGMLPQKLARIMVNLVWRRAGETLLDPFCGVGTVAAQAMLRGLRPIALDRDPGAVADTGAYLAQLRADIGNGVPEPRVIHGDARTLTTVIEPLSLDMVVTEPDLGPALRGRPTRQYAQGLAEQCRALYTEALAEARTVLRPGGRVVWITPAWDCGDIVVHTRLAREFYLAGFTPARPCAAWGDMRTSLTYHRPGQYVRRVLHVLEN